MKPVLIFIVLVAECHLVLKVIPALCGYIPIFISGQVLTEGRVDVQGLLGADGEVMGVERPPLRQPVQLPDAQPRAQRSARKDQQGGQDPFS